MRPSKISGSLSSARICSKSGLLNARHSVTISSASASRSASAWWLAKLSPGYNEALRKVVIADWVALVGLLLALALLLLQQRVNLG